ncbi:MAG: hypothetical protein ACK5MZ_06610 [Aestuariibaculum sp.]
MVNLAVRDVFVLRYEKRFIVQDNFSTYNKKYAWLFFTVGFSYGLGKGEALEYLCGFL